MALEEKRAALGEADAALRAKLNTVKVTTGDVAWAYEIDRVVFNIGSSQGVLGIIGPSPDRAFREAELALKHQAVELGCEAVIFTQFEHRITVDKGLLGPNQGVQVFAYGTAVRRQG